MSAVDTGSCDWSFRCLLSVGGVQLLETGIVIMYMQKLTL